MFFLLHFSFFLCIPTPDFLFLLIPNLITISSLTFHFIQRQIRLFIILYKHSVNFIRAFSERFCNATSNGISKHLPQVPNGIYRRCLSFIIHYFFLIILHQSHQYYTAELLSYVSFLHNTCSSIHFTVTCHVLKLITLHISYMHFLLYSLPDTMPDPLSHTTLQMCFHAPVQALHLLK